jgi:hypothetical protein
VFGGRRASFAGLCKTGAAGAAVRGVMVSTAVFVAPP